MAETQSPDFNSEAYCSSAYYSAQGLVFGMCVPIHVDLGANQEAVSWLRQVDATIVDKWLLECKRARVDKPKAVEKFWLLNQKNMDQHHKDQKDEDLKVKFVDLREITWLSMPHSLHMCVSGFLHCREIFSDWATVQCG